MIKIGQAFTIKKNYNVIKEWKKISLSNYKHKAAFNLNLSNILQPAMKIEQTTANNNIMI